jgi:predicted metal-binding protein
MILRECPHLEKDVNGARLERLVQMAISMGASDARAIASSSISVKNSLAKLCVKPRCANYGLSPSCPPHVAGPSGFRQLQEMLQHAIVVRLVVPVSVLLSFERLELGRFLHELVAGVEQQAILAGYSDSRAFAGGSCKKIFCSDHLECRRLSEQGECRHPEYARPSMSGFGVDVFELIKTCGWPANSVSRETGSDADSMSWVAGLIMIG